MLHRFSLLLITIIFLCSCGTRDQLTSHVLQGRQGDVVVIVFSSTDCPIANSMAPEIERIHKDLQQQGGKLYLVHAWKGRTSKDVASHAKEFGLSMEVLIDDHHELVQRFNATVTPEAVVLSFDEQGASEVVYQGLINNLFASPGNRRDEATKHYVRDAIDAAFAGKDISPSFRKPTGCVIEQMQ